MKKFLLFILILLITFSFSACFSSLKHSPSYVELESEASMLREQLANLEMHYYELQDEYEDAHSSYLYFSDLSDDLQSELSKCKSYIDELEYTVDYYEEIDCYCDFLVKCNFCDAQSTNPYWGVGDTPYCAECLVKAAQAGDEWFSEAAEVAEFMGYKDKFVYIYDEIDLTLMKYELDWFYQNCSCIFSHSCSVCGLEANSSAFYRSDDGLLCAKCLYYAIVCGNIVPAQNYNTGE